MEDAGSRGILTGFKSRWDRGEGGIGVIQASQTAWPPEGFRCWRCIPRGGGAGRYLKQSTSAMDNRCLLDAPGQPMQGVKKSMVSQAAAYSATPQ